MIVAEGGKTVSRPLETRHKSILLRMETIGGTDDTIWYGVDKKGNPDHGALVIHKCLGLSPDRHITVLITQREEEATHDYSIEV